MNRDEKLKQDLPEQSEEFDTLIQDNDSLGSYLSQSLSSELGWLVKIAYMLAILLTILLFYCAYQFFTAPPEKEIFWGVCLILSFQAQVATKLWIFMQSNRSYLSKEIRLLADRKQ
jgi:hypothetical protein